MRKIVAVLLFFVLILSACGQKNKQPEATEQLQIPEGMELVWLESSYVYQDGSYWRSYTYAYDALGRMVQRKYYYMGNLNAVDYWVYDEAGNCVEETVVRGIDSVTKTRTTYNDQGDPVEEISGDRERQWYYEDGCVIRQVTCLGGVVTEESCYRYFQDGTYQREVLDYDDENQVQVREVILYNSQKQILEERAYDQEGNLTKENIYTYNTYGDELTESLWNNSYMQAGVNYTYSWTYDEQGNVLEEVRKLEDDEVYRYEYTRNEAGDILETVHFKDGAEYSRSEYTYDRDGNCLERRVKYSDGDESVITWSYDDYGNCLRQENGNGYYTACTYVPVYVTPERAKELRGE